MEETIIIKNTMQELLDRIRAVAKKDKKKEEEEKRLLDLNQAGDDQDRLDRNRQRDAKLADEE
eukprot:11132414-Heterocapsa_arctica.AAC.1